MHEKRGICFTIKTFQEKKGIISNPYMGFTSFQHFRGKKLYSDYVTGRSSGVDSCEIAESFLGMRKEID